MNTYMKKTLLSVFCLFVLLPVFSSGVLAQYQGSETGGNITVDKKVRDLSDNQLADNIDKSQKIFIDGDGIEFVIAVENNSAIGVSNVQVIDKLPAYLKLVFYPGVYNKSENSIKWQIDSLASGELKKFNIRGTISGVSTNYLSSNPLLLENRVTANGDSDSAKYFVSAKTVPGTGDSEIFLKSLVVLSTLVAGLSLRKFARGY